MKVAKDIMVTCSEGDLEIRMGKAMTSFYFKGVEKFVFRTSELPVLVALITRGQQEQAAFIESITSANPQG